MKLLSQAALLLAALSSCNNVAADRQNVLKYWKGRSGHQVVARDIVIDHNGQPWAPKSVGGKLVKLIPRYGDAARNGNRRRAQESTISPPDGSYHHENMIEFSIPVDTSLADLAFVFVPGNGDAIEVPADDIEGGIATETVGNFIRSYQGVWTWYVQGTKEDGSVVKTDELTFEVGPEIVRRSGGGQTIVAEDAWSKGGQVQGATGRIYFASTDHYGDTYDYACSGTVIKDNKTGRSLILSAAHCVWDDIDGNFGHDVVFIPNRDAIDAEDGYDIFRACEKDICGCWTVSGGVVHDLWRDKIWPDNLPYDYGFWIVDDVGSHDGTQCRDTEALDVAVDELEFAVGDDVGGIGTFTHNFGYSLAYDPDFRYCAEEVSTDYPVEGVETYWMPSCLHSGGASGGPWIQNLDESTGAGQIYSVSSWSLGLGDSGMGGPIIEESAARCLANAAREADFLAMETEAEGHQGIFVNCYERPCIPEEEVARRKLRGQSRELCEDKE